MLRLPATSACSNGAAASTTPLLTAKGCCLKRGEKENTHVGPGGRRWRQQEVQREPGRLRLGWLASPLAAAILALSPPCIIGTPVSVGQTDVTTKGAALFQKACIGCHDAGGNILQPGATLFTRDFGKGRMPGFGEKCTPRGQCTFGARLQEEEIKQLAEFVRSQADRGWPKLDYGE